MRSLHGSTQVLLALGLLFHGCTRSQQKPTEEVAVGQPAPEIAGEDLDGIAFRLSDYRGRVVVLDFWGNW